jgi:hypothetical protein
MLPNFTDKLSNELQNVAHELLNITYLLTPALRREQCDVHAVGNVAYVDNRC